MSERSDQRDRPLSHEGEGQKGTCPSPQKVALLDALFESARQKSKTPPKRKTTELSL